MPRYGCSGQPGAPPSRRREPSGGRRLRHGWVGAAPHAQATWVLSAPASPLAGVLDPLRSGLSRRPGDGEDEDAQEPPGMGRRFEDQRGSGGGRGSASLQPRLRQLRRPSPGKAAGSRSRALSGQPGRSRWPASSSGRQPQGPAAGPGQARRGDDPGTHVAALHPAQPLQTCTPRPLPDPPVPPVPRALTAGGKEGPGHHPGSAKGYIFFFQYFPKILVWG